MSDDAQGGSPRAVDSQDVQEAAKFAVRELAAQSNSLLPPELKEVGSLFI